MFAPANIYETTKRRLRLSMFSLRWLEWLIQNWALWTDYFII